MNLTQLAGMIAFALAATACALRRRSLPALVFAGGVIELQLGWRFKLHDAVEPAILRAAAPYADKYHVQYVLLAIGAMLVIGLARSLRGSSVAGYAALGMVGLIALETISLHAIDAVCWRLIGPIMVIGWSWVAVALIAVADALFGPAAASRPSGRSVATRTPA